MGNYNWLIIYFFFDIIYCSIGVEVKGGGRLRVELLDLGVVYFFFDKLIEVCYYCS